MRMLCPYVRNSKATSCIEANLVVVNKIPHYEMNFDTESNIPGGTCSRAAKPTSTEMRTMMIHSNFSDFLCDNTSRKNLALSAISASCGYSRVRRKA